MGRLCRAAKRLIDDAGEAAETAAKRALREARAAKAAAKRKVDDTAKAIDELPPKGTGTELQEETRKIYEDLKKGYDEELKKATEALDRLQGVSRAYDDGRRRVDDALAMLDRRDAEFRGLSFEAASTRILALLQELPRRPGKPPPPEDPCPPFASAADFALLDAPPPVVDLDARARLLSDAGLDGFARSLGATPPSQLAPALQLPARVFYATVAPGLSRLELARDLGGGSAFVAPMVRELFDDAIAATARVPVAALQRERAFQCAEPLRLAEFARLQALPGLVFQVRGEAADGLARDDGRGGRGTRKGDAARRRLIQQKTFVLARRAQARNRRLAQGLLAVFGLDFLLEEEDQEALDRVLNYFVIGEWLLGAVALLALILRLLAHPRLWEKLVRRYGRLGAIRFLAGLGGRLVPALMAAAIAYAWVEICREWLQDAAAFDRELRAFYDAAPADEVPDRDAIFIANLGYVPPPLPQ